MLKLYIRVIMGKKATIILLIHINILSFIRIPNPKFKNEMNDKETKQENIKHSSLHLFPTPCFSSFSKSVELLRLMPWIRNSYLTIKYRTNSSSMLVCDSINDIPASWYNHVCFMSVNTFTRRATSRAWCNIIFNLQQHQFEKTWESAYGSCNIMYYLLLSKILL
jgi:hypothetical protein